MSLSEGNVNGGVARMQLRGRYAANPPPAIGGLVGGNLEIVESTVNAPALDCAEGAAEAASVFGGC